GLVIKAVVFARVDGAGVLLVAIPFLPGVGREGLAFGRNDILDGQLVFLGEGKIAFVVGGHAHDGAVAVAHEYVVADPDFDLLAGKRVRDRQAGAHAFFFARGDF